MGIQNYLTERNLHFHDYYQFNLLLNNVIYIKS
jgi:hypothetical protein